MCALQVGNSSRGQGHGWASEDTWRQKAHGQVCATQTGFESAQRPALHLRREAQRSGVRWKRWLGGILLNTYNDLAYNCSIRFSNSET